MQSNGIPEGPGEFDDRAKPKLLTHLGSIIPRGRCAILI